MIKTDINTLLSKFDSRDGESIHRVSMLMTCNYCISIDDIQHELKIGYMQASELLNLFVDAGILKKINNPIPDDSDNKNYYELLISKSKFAELSSLLCFEEQLKGYAIERKMTQTLQALEFIRKKKAWQKQKKEGYFNISPLAMAHNAFEKLDIQDDDAMVTILLQDMVKCYGFSLEELPVTDKVRNSIGLLTFHVDGEKTKEFAKKRYYDRIAEDREATLTALVDKLNNFPEDRAGHYVENAKEHIKEVHEYVMPLIDKAKEMYPEDSKAISYVEYNITSVVNSMDVLVKVLERGFRKPR